MEIFPPGGKDIEHRWQRIISVNEVVRNQADGDILTSFSQISDLADNWLSIKEELYEFDLLHLNADGYKQWDSSWNSTFYNLWEGRPIL